MHACKNSRRTVYNVKKHADAIIKNATYSAASLTTKNNRAPLLPEIEKRLYNFKVIRRVYKLPVACSVFQQRTSLLREILLSQ